MATIRSLLWVRLRRAATPLPPSALPLLRPLPARLCRRRIAAADRNLAALGEADKSGRHDPLGRFKTLADHRLRLVLLLDRDRPHRNGVVVFDHVHEGTVWSSLHGAGRDHYDLPERVDQQPDVDELAGPELQFGIREFGLELYGAGRLVDLIVDHPEHAAIDHRIVVRALGFDAERALFEGGVHLREILLRQIEKHRDRLQLRDYHDR